MIAFDSDFLTKTLKGAVVVALRLKTRHGSSKPADIAHQDFLNERRLLLPKDKGTYAC